MSRSKLPYRETTDTFLLYKGQIVAQDRGTYVMFPGGGLDPGESAVQASKRECMEEISYWKDDFKLVPVQKFVNNTFAYHTFFCEVEKEFMPILNDEHSGYAWVGSDKYPKPLHPGLFSTINIDNVVDKLSSLKNL